MMTNKNLVRIIILGLTVFINNILTAQTEMPERRLADLKQLDISHGVSLHIISPEPIQFVDLSTSNLTGDLPSENIARVKITDVSGNDSISKNSFNKTDNLGIITVVCQSFMAQYKLNYINDNGDAVSNIQIQPDDMQPLEYPKIVFSKLELQKLSMDLVRKKVINKPIREVGKMNLKMQINNIYVLNDYIFLDINIENSSNLTYNIDGLNFSLEDKKIYKATNNQSLEIVPVFQLYNQKIFRKNYRNIYVFKKLTYPNSKVMKIRLTEEQLSGRAVEMTVKYSDVLHADTF